MKIYLLQYYTNCCGQIYNYKVGIYSSINKVREERDKYLKTHSDFIDKDYDGFSIYEFELDENFNNDNNPKAFN